MKVRIAIVYMMILSSILLSSCTKNDLPLDLNVTVNSNDVYAGQDVIFEVSGEAEFVTFYNGADSATSYSNYPFCKGLPVKVGEVKTVYNTQGSYTATFIATSHDNWGNDSETKQFNFIINVVDNRTGVKSFSVKTGGLLGNEYEGVIDEDNSAIAVTTDPDTDISNMLTIFITESNDVTVELDGAEFENKSKVDYSAGSKVFTVIAPDGTKQMWTVTVSN